MFTLINRKNKLVLCNGDKITGSRFKPPFYRGRIRKSIVKWKNRLNAEKDMKIIESTDACPFSLNELEVIPFTNLWHF